MQLPGLRSLSNLRTRALLSLVEGVETSSSKLVKVRMTSNSHASLLIMGAESAPLSSRALIALVSRIILGGNAVYLHRKRKPQRLPYRLAPCDSRKSTIA
jgi:hypothetical protein